MDRRVGCSLSRRRGVGCIFVQRIFDTRSFSNCRFVKAAQLHGTRRDRVDKDKRGDLHLQSHAVKCDYIPKKHPDGVISLRGFAIIQIQHRFKPTGRAVRQITNCSAGQWRQPRPAREFLISKIITNEIDSVGCHLLSGSILLNNRPITLATNNHPWIRSDKRVTRHTFTTFDRFQQKGVFSVSGDS